MPSWRIGSVGNMTRMLLPSSRWALGVQKLANRRGALQIDAAFALVPGGPELSEAFASSSCLPACCQPASREKLRRPGQVHSRLLAFAGGLSINFGTSTLTADLGHPGARLGRIEILKIMAASSFLQVIHSLFKC